MLSRAMELSVQLFDARNLKPYNRPHQAYAQLTLGSTKRKSSVSPSGTQQPYWLEIFSFDVDNLKAELCISLWSQDRLPNAFLGRIRVPVAVILSAENQTIPSAWYPLQKRSNISKTPITGEVRVSFSLSGRAPSSPIALLGCQLSDATSSSVSDQPSTTNGCELTSNGSTSSSSATVSHGFVAWLSSLFLRNLLVAWLLSKLTWFFPDLNKNQTDTDETREEVAENSFDDDEGLVLPSFFEDDGTFIPSSEEDMPTPLGGGVLLSGTYVASAKALNGILFGPESQFAKDFNEFQKTTNVVEGPWRKGEDQLPKRVITYVKAATKFVSSVKATESQVYARADEKGFVVNISAITPDVPCGKSFQVDIQFCIFAGSDTNTGEKTSRLRVSWGLHFLSNTMMKTVIEKGARQGLQDSYKQYAQVLEKYAKPLRESSMAGGEARNSEPFQQKRADVDVLTFRSDWQLAREYFYNLRVCITLTSIFIVSMHVYSSSSCPKSGLEVWKLDLPDTLSELIAAALLGAQIQSIIGMARKFLGARLLRDQGTKRD